MTSRPFHAMAHVRPAEAVPGPLLEVEGDSVRTLQLPARSDRPFEISFESAAAALAGLDRLFLEPDGAFVWVSPAGGPDWQLDGMLYDRGGHLLYVELKGNCDEPAFDRFLSAIGWPRTPVMFQLARAAVFLDEAEFRRYAGWRI